MGGEKVSDILFIINIVGVKEVGGSKEGRKRGKKSGSENRRRRRRGRKKKEKGEEGKNKYIEL